MKAWEYMGFESARDGWIWLIAGLDGVVLVYGVVIANAMHKII